MEKKRKKYILTARAVAAVAALFPLKVQMGKKRKKFALTSRIAAATIAMAAWTDAHAQKKAEPELTEADVARIDAEAREAYRLQEAKKAATAGGRIAALKKHSEEEEFYLKCLRRFIYTDEKISDVNLEISRELREATYAKAESAQNKLLEKSDSSSRMKRMTTQQLIRLEANARAPIAAKHARLYEIMGLAYTTRLALAEEELAKIPRPKLTPEELEKYSQKDENGRPLHRTVPPSYLARGKKRTRAW